MPLAVLLLSTYALATPRSASLSWVRLEGAESCVSPGDLARAIETELGQSIFSAPATADLTVEGHAERAAEGWRAVIRVSDRSGLDLGIRTVESHATTCEELGRVVAVAVSLLVDPPEAAPEVKPGPEAPKIAAPQPRWRFGVDGALTVGAGPVPGVGVGGVGDLRLRPPKGPTFVATGEIIPFSRLESDGGPIDFSRLVGALLVCPLRHERGAIELEACLGVGAGVVFVLDSVPTVPNPERVLVEAQAALNLRYTVLGPLQLRAGVHPAVPFRQVTFSPEGGEPWSPAPVAVAVDVGLALAF